MASSYVVLRCRAFRSFFSILGFTWLPPAIYRKNNWVCERDKWQVRSHLKPAKGVGWQKLIRIHCPLSNCKLFMIPRSPPPSSTSFSYSDGLSKGYMASFSITLFQNSLLTVLRDLTIKVSFKVKKIDLVEIMSLNVMDEAVLRSPERCPLAVLRLPVHHVLQVRGPVDLTARDCIPWIKKTLHSKKIISNF